MQLRKILLGSLGFNSVLANAAKNLSYILHEAISAEGDEPGGMKPTLTLRPREAHSYIIIPRACALTFSKPSLKVARCRVCGLRRLRRNSRPRERAHLASPRTDLQSFCIKRTVFIIALHTTLFYSLREPFLKLKRSTAQDFEKLSMLDEYLADNYNPLKANKSTNMLLHREVSQAKTNAGCLPLIGFLLMRGRHPISSPQSPQRPQT
ncbi:unnamed protein product [Pleuronectes platessa]|uniref:Uncharacterized protein n=1 Tax=Pleuronectes platessa TaxID=8262 RepID=A0A9N7Z7U6_PLEPL|nr:unnamed protein product [Pleuronectes platessa]